MLKKYLFLALLYLSIFAFRDVLFASDAHDYGLVYIGGKSASSSSATTGTTSTPSMRYTTPTIRSVPSTIYTSPSVFQQQQMDRLNKNFQKQQRRRDRRERNEALLRMFGILP